jgi:hypothetical protein
MEFSGTTVASLRDVVWAKAVQAKISGSAPAANAATIERLSE